MEQVKNLKGRCLTITLYGNFSCILFQMYTNTAMQSFWHCLRLNSHSMSFCQGRKHFYKGLPLSCIIIGWGKLSFSKMNDYLSWNPTIIDMEKYKYMYMIFHGITSNMYFSQWPTRMNYRNGLLMNENTTLVKSGISRDYIMLVIES